MEKYRLVGEKKSDSSIHDSGDLCEVKITQQGKPKNYITYAMNLFDQGAKKVVLKAMGRAINKAVTIAEILKRKEPLHQITLLTSSEIIDVSTRLFKLSSTIFSYSIENNVLACLSQNFSFYL